MSQYQYDLFVIGAGSGGVRASRMASQLGAKVAVAEDKYLGGTCVNVGCVPKKLFVYGSHFSEDFEAAKGYGWDVGQPAFHWPTLRDSKNAEIDRLNGVYEKMLANAGVDIISGKAVIVDPHSVQVGGQVYTAERILVATGGWPRQPQYPGAEHTITSNEVFYLEQFPQSVLVEGGGYIAVEFAGIFNGLGCETEIVYRGPQVLRSFDEGIGQFVQAQIHQKGVKLNLENGIESIEKRDDGKLQVQFSNGSSHAYDLVLSAIGRTPVTQGIGLENTQVRLSDRGTIIVNDVMQTDEPSIYAIGDVVGRMELTPVALAEGMALAHYWFNNQPMKLDYTNIATAIFCQPNVATVGLTEKQARDVYGAVDVYQTDFRHMKNTMTDSMERVMMKLVVEQSTQKVVGCHMVGPDAGEIIQGFAVAMKAGATKQDFDNTVGIHPTAAEEFVTLRQKVR
jgi:glutathione reductase (NADPH)